MRANSVANSRCADSPIVRAVPVGAWRSPVSAPVWGTGGRGFKSRRPDQSNQEFLHFPLAAHVQNCPLGKSLGMKKPRTFAQNNEQSLADGSCLGNQAERRSSA
jgi:hypothetical protein